MAPGAKFSALPGTPDEDGNGRSIELLSLGPRKQDLEIDYRKPQQKTQRNRRLTFRERTAGFPWRTIFVVACLPLALAPICALAGAAETVSRSYIRGRECYQNGLWKEAPDATWRIMDSSYFFTPNLSFGQMTFTQVKVIDIAWDLIVGRGGQLLLAWVNYRVFNEWLVYHMELHLTSYKLYAAVAFETTTVKTLGVLGKEFLAFGKGTWRRFFRWLGILCMVLSTLYVLSFPTLMAALTGYITTYEAYVKDIDNNLIDMSRFSRVLYVIDDARRIEYEKPVLVTAEDTDLIVAVQKYITQFKDDDHHSFSPVPYPELGWTRDIRDENSTWDGPQGTKSLPAPSLNITSYLISNERPLSVLEPFVMAFYSFAKDGPQGDQYRADWVVDNTSCKPSETYQWGFSYIFLFMVSIFNFIWSCIMVVMWMDTRRSSRMYRAGRRPGLLRSILDYSAAVRQELGTDAEYLEEEELRTRVRESGGALVVPKSELRITRANTNVVRERGWKRTLTKGSTF